MMVVVVKMVVRVNYLCDGSRECGNRGIVLLHLATETFPDPKYFVTLMRL